MKLINSFCLFILISVITLSCGKRNAGCKLYMTQPHLKYIERELDSNWIYQVTIPENYRIEKSGFIDYFVYSLIAPDSAINNFGKAEIHYSKNLYNTLQRPNFVPTKDSSISGEVLNTPITWTIFQYDSTVSAETFIEDDDIGITVTSTNYSHLDSLIRIISSLKEKH